MNGKFENVLNLALSTGEEEREETNDLNVGFDAETDSWELIVKYSSSLERLERQGILVEYLIAGYAILNVPVGKIELVENAAEIEYVEKPKQYYFDTVGPADNACISGITVREPFLSGTGVLVAVLDTGIEYTREDFRNPDGSTRIQFLWDQTLMPEGNQKIPEGYSMGVEFDREQINQALEEVDSGKRYGLLPSFDSSGHGTAVTGILAGFVEGVYEGVAPKADLLIVKLGQAKPNGFPKTTQIMRGVTYALRKAAQLQMPLVINLSFGNTYGSHSGSSLLERFLDNAGEIGRTVICVGTGNEGNSNGHVSGFVTGETIQELAIGEYEKNLSVQFWKNAQDIFQVYLISPAGNEVVFSPDTEGGSYSVRVEATKLLFYFGKPTPYSVYQEIYVEFIPVNQYINSGIWKILIRPEKIVTGEYAMYLPSGVVRSSYTGFLRPTFQGTFTIPATASKVISVGAYDDRYDGYADFSGRGYAYGGEGIPLGYAKPDVVAQGVNVLAPALYGGYAPVTGTSFATPIVAGSAALLMEWGIVRGEDPYLYGEKLKAYLRSGALPLRGEERYPNERTGYGKVCVAASLYA